MNKEHEGQYLKEVSRGDKAKAVVENELFQEATKEIKDKVFRSWVNSDGGSIEDRERLWLTYKIVGKVEKYLNDIVRTGRMAQDALDELDK